MKAKLLPVLLLFALPVMAQKDPAAGKILDGFSGAALSAPSVSMEFTLRVNDKVEDTVQESEGTVVIKGNMYMLEIPENIIWYNGSSTWTLSPEVKEVTVTLPDPEENSFMTSPSSLFDMYKEGFKYRLLQETQQGSLIDLYPEDPSDTDFSMIRLLIGKQGDLVSAEYKRKDGIDLYLNITRYSLTEEYSDSYFTFDPSRYPDVDIIDMR